MLLLRVVGVIVCCALATVCVVAGITSKDPVLTAACAVLWYHAAWTLTRKDLRTA